MDEKTPFLAGVQQELFFLPEAARHLSASGATDPDQARTLLEAAVREGALGDGHLEGLGVLGADREDADGLPARPDRDAVIRAMAEDCLEQLQHLDLCDEAGRVTPQQLTVAETRAQLRRAVIRNYGVEGRDGEKRSVVSRLYGTFDALEEEDPEQEEDPRSVVNRRGLCLAEFMRLHFWMQGLPPDRAADEPPWRAPYWEFAEEVLETRRQALEGLDAGEGGIEYAALVMADAATEWLLERHPDARNKLAAARSTVLMLCDAGVLAPHGFPGGVQWLRPVDDLGRRQRRGQRRRRRQGLAAEDGGA